LKNKKKHYSFSEIKIVFASKSEDKIIELLNSNTIKLNNKLANFIFINAILYLNLNQNIYKVLINAKKFYTIFKRYIVEEIIKNNKYNALILLEKNGFTDFNLRDKLLTIVSKKREPLLIKEFNLLIQNNNIDNDLRDELLLHSTTILSPHFFEIIINIGDPIKKSLLKDIALFTIKPDNIFIFKLAYNQNNTDFKLFAGLAAKHFSFNILEYLYSNTLLSYEHLLYIYNLLILENYNTTPYSNNSKLFFKKVDKELNFRKLQNKITHF